MDWSCVWNVWCFHQLFKLPFWRHPFTLEDFSVSKWCNAVFLQICFNKKNNYQSFILECTMLDIFSIMSCWTVLVHIFNSIEIYFLHLQMLNVEVGFMSEAWLMILQKVAIDIFLVILPSNININLLDIIIWFPPLYPCSSVILCSH